MRSFPGARFQVLVNDAPEGGLAAWRELLPGVTVEPSRHSGAIAVWIRPYPGHAGGFMANGRAQPNGDTNAHALAQAFDLFDNEAIAGTELIDVPHVEAFPYLVAVDDLQGRVLLLRLPGVLDDYIEYAEADDLGGGQAKRRCWSDC